MTLAADEIDEIGIENLFSTWVAGRTRGEVLRAFESMSEDVHQDDLIEFAEGILDEFDVPFGDEKVLADLRARFGDGGLCKATEWDYVRWVEDLFRGYTLVKKRG